MLYGCDSQEVLSPDEQSNPNEQLDAGGTPPDFKIAGQIAPPPPTYDDLLYKVAELAPDFAGVLTGPDGRLKILVRRYDEHVREGRANLISSDVMVALRAVFGADLRDLGSFEDDASLAPDVISATYSFKELKDWYDEADAVWSVKGMHTSDIDEVENVLQFEVDDKTAMEEVRAVLLNLNIPEDAFEVYVAGRFENLSLTGASTRLAASNPPSHIRSSFSPLVGGIEIDRGDSGANLCTIGFTANSSSGPSFVTNSHCTAVLGGPDPTTGGANLMNQPYNGGLAGEEVWDPPFSSSLPGCPSGRICRFSDSALYYAYVSGAVDVGKVANPYLPDITGTIYLHPSTPYLTITGSASNLAIGQPVWAIGRTKGGFAGSVSDTCVKSSPDATHTYLCQDVAFVDPIPEAGDSGGPVFQFDPLDDSKIKIAGILRGKGAAGTSHEDELIYSKYSHVSNDLTAVAF